MEEVHTEGAGTILGVVPDVTHCGGLQMKMATLQDNNWSFLHNCYFILVDGGNFVEVELLLQFHLRFAIGFLCGSVALSFCAYMCKSIGNGTS